MIEVAISRRLWSPHDTPGAFFVDGVFICHSLEDPVREIPGKPVTYWKRAGASAIGAGQHELALVDSPRFGPNTLTIVNVPGFTYIRIHAGNDEEDTEGCPLAGDRLEPDLELGGARIAGGTSRPALERLRGLIVPRMLAGERAIIKITNPPAWVDNYRGAL